MLRRRRRFFKRRRFGRRYYGRRRGYRRFRRATRSFRKRRAFRKRTFWKSTKYLWPNRFRCKAQFYGTEVINYAIAGTSFDYYLRFKNDCLSDPLTKDSDTTTAGIDYQNIDWARGIYQAYTVKAVKHFVIIHKNGPWDGTKNQANNYDWRVDIVNSASGTYNPDSNAENVHTTINTKSKMLTGTTVDQPSSDLSVKHHTYATAKKIVDRFNPSVFEGIVKSSGVWTQPSSHWYTHIRLKRVTPATVDAASFRYQWWATAYVEFYRRDIPAADNTL